MKCCPQKKLENLTFFQFVQIKIMNSKETIPNKVINRNQNVASILNRHFLSQGVEMFEIKPFHKKKTKDYSLEPQMQFINSQYKNISV